MADPLALLTAWLPDGGAMTLATTAPDGGPRARTVLVTGVVDGGLRFHSSTPTGKTVDLAHDPRACGVFHWSDAGRQAVVTGRVHELDATVSDAAFAVRPPHLQRVAWLYDAVLPTLRGPRYEVDPSALDATTDVPARRPASWTTFALVPTTIEVWLGGPDRVASRTRYVRDGDTWAGVPVLP
ncbi:pyridoxamine 5'-phosphate oxidase family protein [Actinomycetospora sp. NBRC 106378]|uniref:pyridoxine/pyridoxamine 5'-phosphate oxidase n=1 Tax=Actinomycetospora sp. NBRC 106378 TaxID=3032208 RepID=UPI0024A46A51|nr:pyridoxamine 5'-phosphate oxidase family protein [Actinomycetospora sp. NBRC 106378]GLZ53951.1 pyridoxine/pyridoxamine 5'-phosphate oxidase [Actinomycetospora sp. NBRC 106378]